MSNISRVTDAKLSGVYLRHDLNFSKHVDAIAATCSQRLYLLTRLKRQGLGISSLDTTFKAIVLNNILYALQVISSYYILFFLHQLFVCYSPTGGFRQLFLGWMLDQVLALLCLICVYVCSFCVVICTWSSFAGTCQVTV